MAVFFSKILLESYIVFIVNLLNDYKPNNNSNIFGCKNNSL